MNRKMVGRNFFKDTRGAAAAEFALLAPILLFLMIGVADFGRYLHMKMQIDNLARNAAEYVRQGGDPDYLQQDVLLQAEFLGSEAETLEVTAEEFCECADGVEAICSASSPCSGGYMRRFFAVELRQTYRSMLPYPGLPEEIILTGFSRMQTE
ncbi:MAG: pilus assembly protein [Micavibrio sp.]|nr:MAG: pilus assembly protein [Micavibrio sp.]